MTQNSLVAHSRCYLHARPFATSRRRRCRLFGPLSPPSEALENDPGARTARAEALLRGAARRLKPPARGFRGPADKPIVLFSRLLRWRYFFLVGQGTLASAGTGLATPRNVTSIFPVKPPLGQVFGTVP